MWPVLAFVIRALSWEVVEVGKTGTMEVRESIAVYDVEVMPALPHNREGVKPVNARSEEEIYQLLTAVIESGGNVTETARKYEIPRRTLQTWLAAYKEDVEIQNEVRRLEVAGIVGRQAKELASAASKAKMDKAGIKDLAIATGIFIDKWRDLAGPTTGSGETTLRIAWQNGSGAVELKTNSSPK